MFWTVLLDTLPLTYICCTGRADIWNMCCQITEIFLSSKTFISLSPSFSLWSMEEEKKIPTRMVNWQLDNEKNFFYQKKNRYAPSPKVLSRHFLPVLHYLPCIWFMVIRASVNHQTSVCVSSAGPSQPSQRTSVAHIFPSLARVSTQPPKFSPSPKILFSSLNISPFSEKFSLPKQ